MQIITLASEYSCIAPHEQSFHPSPDLAEVYAFTRTDKRMHILCSRTQTPLAGDVLEHSSGLGCTRPASSTAMRMPLCQDMCTRELRSACVCLAHACNPHPENTHMHTVAASMWRTARAKELLPNTLTRRAIAAGRRCAARHMRRTEPNRASCLRAAQCAIFLHELCGTDGWQYAFGAKFHNADSHRTSGAV